MDGHNKKIGKANEKRKREKVKKSKSWGSEWTREEKGGTSAPHRAIGLVRCLSCNCSHLLCVWNLCV